MFARSTHNYAHWRSFEDRSNDIHVYKRHRRIKTRWAHSRSPNYISVSAFEQLRVSTCTY